MPVEPSLAPEIVDDASGVAAEDDGDEDDAANRPSDCFDV
jgi:hypothetical protein